MTISSVASGTQLATVSTEHTLSTITSAGTYVLVVDTANMLNGDTLELRANVQVITSVGSPSAIPRQYIMATFANVQSDPVKISIPVPSVDSVVFTLKQTAGTQRNFDWNVYKL